MVDENKGWDKRIDELTDKEMIKPEQKESMKKMLESPDEENAEVVKEIVKIKLEDRLVIGLNNDQTNAFNTILTFLREGGADALVLKGYAGTGKTFLVRRIIEYITASYPNRKIAITAPTNKAVRVLQGNAPFKENSDDEPIFEDLFNAGSRLKYSTVHKLLGLKEQISNAGVQSFKPDYKDKSELDKYKYLIVDEVSMLDDTLCRELLKHKDKVKIIFMGDPAQIPPVNRVDCIPFKEQVEFTFKQAELKEIMRQTGEHPVIDASFLIRNNLKKTQPIMHLETNLNDEGKGIVYIPNTPEGRKGVRPILDQYFNCEEFKKDADYAKVIAWRNVRVAYLNTIIRELLFGKEVDAYVPGEKLVANGAIFEEQKGNKRWGAKWIVSINTSEEMEVEEVQIVTQKFAEGSYQLYAKVYQCKVKIFSATEGKFITDYIKIIHEDAKEDYQTLLKQAKGLAVNARDKSAWVAYYNMIKWSADVAYNYAITCHKAQGSTYNNVILMEEDIDKNRTVLERNRIKYTAYSRPTDKLFILRKNYNV
jgi:exodeoxyribonuclease-5